VQLQAVNALQYIEGQKEKIFSTLSDHQNGEAILSQKPKRGPL